MQLQSGPALFLVAGCLGISTAASAQNAGQPTNGSQTSAPVTTQIKQAVVFLSTSCLQDFSQIALQMTKERLMQMPPQQQALLAQQTFQVITRLATIPSSMAKLSKEDQDYISQNVAPVGIAANELPDYISWRLTAISRMTAFSEQEFAQLSDADVNKLPSQEFLGTGFFVSYPDPRVPLPEGEKGPASFVYLVTNRHVVEPGIEDGKPCKRLGTTILLNRKPDPTHPNDYVESDRIDKIVHWSYPEDQSVDLAAAPFNPGETNYDFKSVGTNLFVTEKQLVEKQVVEGDPLMFTGLFIQSFSELHTLEPIVRSGTLAMIPEGTLFTTIKGQRGHIFLAEAHAFGGNSGSPVFVDTTKFTNRLGYSYELLGVISGEVFENSDMTLNVTTTASGSVQANSDVSVVVPATELLKVLNGDSLSKQRDEIIRSLPKPPSPPTPQPSEGKGSMIQPGQPK